MNKRKSISKRKRFDVFKRDSFTCQYCGAHPPHVILHIDHIIPVVEGGGNEIENLVTACESCNLGKSANLLADVPPSLADRAKEVAEREEQIRGYAEVMQARADRIENEAWAIAAALKGAEYLESYDGRRLLSIRRFLEQMAYHHVLEAAEITRAKFYQIGNRAFRYFCGICWARIREEGHGAG